jgi:polyferredoxin
MKEKECHNYCEECGDCLDCYPHKHEPVIPVHNEPVAREFWISFVDETPIFESYISNKIPSALSEDDNFMCLKDSKCTHVIEYAAYAQLKEKLEIAIDFVKKSHHIDKCKVREGANCSCNKFIIEALEKMK